MKCIVPKCNNSDQKKRDGVSFHKFPRNHIKRSKWLLSLQIENTANISNRHIVCSKHFNEADYEPNMFGRRKLKKGSLPKLEPSLISNVLYVTSTSFIKSLGNCKENNSSTSEARTNAISNASDEQECDTRIIAPSIDEQNEHRAVINFFVKKGLSPSEIHTEMLSVLGKNFCPSFTSVWQWATEFKQNLTTFEDDPLSLRPTSS